MSSEFTELAANLCLWGSADNGEVPSGGEEDGGEFVKHVTVSRSVV